MKKTVLSLLTAAFALSTSASCFKKDIRTEANLKTYVLVHGAWQAPYVWETVQADLVSKGRPLALPIPTASSFRVVA